MEGLKDVTRVVRLQLENMSGKRWNLHGLAL